MAFISWETGKYVWIWVIKRQALIATFWYTYDLFTQLTYKWNIDKVYDVIM